MAERTIDWSGKSGETYRYWIYDIGETFKELPGNYIFAKETKPNIFSPIYIGETENLKERLVSSHEKMPCIERNGVTHICTHTSDQNEATRRAEESDLIELWQPICNA